MYWLLDISGKISLQCMKVFKRKTQFCMLLTPVFPGRKRGGLKFTDEPTGNLDSGNSRDVMDLLMKASRYYQQTILMISGSMNSSVARRIRFFGMMRCLGADQRQVRRFVRREALNWCRTAIPLGLGISIIVVWGLCAVLRAVSPAYFSGMQMFGVSIPGLLAGAVIGLTTVILAARSPAKRASRVSLPDCGIGKCREYICGPKDRACQILPCGGCPRDSSCRGERKKLSFDVRFICFQYHSFPELQPRA